MEGFYLPGTPNNQPVSYGCFNWMIPNHDIENGWKSPNIHLKTGCLGYQVEKLFGKKDLGC